MNESDVNGSSQDLCCGASSVTLKLLPAPERNDKGCATFYLLTRFPRCLRAYIRDDACIRRYAVSSPCKLISVCLVSPEGDLLARQPQRAAPRDVCFESVITLTPITFWLDNDTQLRAGDDRPSFPRRVWNTLLCKVSNPNPWSPSHPNRQVLEKVGNARDDAAGGPTAVGGRHRPWELRSVIHFAFKGFVEEGRRDASRGGGQQHPASFLWRLKDDGIRYSMDGAIELR